MTSRKIFSRPVISILMLFGFITILVTGLLSYGLRYNPLLSAVHTIFGLTFVGLGIVHLWNNLRSMVQYFGQPKGRRWAAVSVLMVFVIVFGSIASIPPFQTVTDLGYALKELKPIDRHMTETLYTQFGEQGQKLSIEVKAGPAYTGPGAVFMGVTITGVPQMAVWVEDKHGNYLETLYVTKKASNSSYIQSLFSGDGVRRPEALPHWSYSRGIEGDDGLMMPSADKPIADAVTGATPVSNFDLRSVTKVEQGEIIVKFEINRSYDFNEFYHRKAFPHDPIYSGSGSSAQPSLIYSTMVNLDSKPRYYFMSLIGRGHHSGRDGQIYTDLSGVTTAKEIVSRVIVEVL